MFALVFAAGLALRVLAELAYRPALLYIDSDKYLAGPYGSEPEGYRLLLRLLDPLGGFGLVAAAQHGFGLAMAGAGYALLIRRRVPRWLAALAVAPVLLDAYQLQLEQTIMPDAAFETMITAGLVPLLWRRRPGLPLVAAGALILGAATTVREIGAVLIVPVMIFALLIPNPLTTRRWRCRAGRAALAGACFALPLLGYMTAAYGATGHFGLARNGPGPEYGRAAAAADCATLKVPADERALCPSPALTLALGGVDGLLNNRRSPGLTVPVPAAGTREKLLASFSLAVLRQQPLRVVAAIARDSVRLFALTRDGAPEITAISRWQFQTSYPTYPPRFTTTVFTQLAHQNNGGELVAVKPTATVLRDYQLHGGYTPGPLYALALAAGLGGSLSGLRRRRTFRAVDTELAAACTLVTLSAVVLLAGSDAFEFSWRYQLPAVILLPLAGALGFTAVAARITAARNSKASREPEAPTAARTATGGTGRRTQGSRPSARLDPGSGTRKLPTPVAPMPPVVPHEIPALHRAGRLRPALSRPRGPPSRACRASTHTPAVTRTRWPSGRRAPARPRPVSPPPCRRERCARPPSPARRAT